MRTLFALLAVGFASVLHAITVEEIDSKQHKIKPALTP